MLQNFQKLGPNDMQDIKQILFIISFSLLGTCLLKRMDKPMDNPWKSFSDLCSRKDRQISQLFRMLKELEDECEAYQQRYTHILQLGNPKRQDFNLPTKEIPTKGDSDSSLEFDDNFQQVDTRKEKSLEKAEAKHESEEEEEKPEASKPRLSSLLHAESAVTISPQLVTQIVDENRRLQMKIKDTIRQWRKVC